MMMETRPGSGASSGHAHPATAHERLVEQIYDASQRPQLWPGVLEAIGQIIEAPFGFMILGDSDAPRWTGAPGFEGILERMVREAWLERGTYPRRLPKLCASRFVADQEAMPIEELRDEPTFRDFLLPSGVSFGATTSAELPTGERVTIGWRRRSGDDPLGPSELEKLDSLRPTLVQALSLWAQSHQRGLIAVVETLAGLGLPALILDSERHVLATNRLLEAVKPDVAWSAREFALRDAAADAGLRNALSRLQSENANAVMTFPVKAMPGNGFIARLLPLRSQDKLARATAALVLAPTAARWRPPKRCCDRSSA